MIDRWIERLAALQASRPLIFILAAIVTVFPAGYLARGLELRTGFGELLPEKQTSVIEQKRTASRLPSVSVLAVTAESQNTELLKRFIDEMVPKLRELAPDVVSDVEGGTHEVEGFFREHKHLYADLADIEALHDDVIERYDWEVGAKLGHNLDIDEPPELTAETVQARFEKRIEKAKSEARGLDGYHIGEDGTFAVILVRTKLAAMDQRAFDLQRQIEELVAAADYRAVDPDFRLGFTGNLITSAEAYREVSSDLTEIGIIGIGLVLGVVFFFFWRVRVLLALAFTVGVGAVWCFAFAELTVGHLNTATGFLVSVVVGNGINAMVIYMARFIEARRDEGLDTAAAVRVASTGTYVATFAGVGVAMVSYGALMTTEFRGFRHFGIIGAAGMFSCWVATYTVLPAVLALIDRYRPLSKRRFTDRLGASYGKPFIWFAKRFTRPVAVVGVAVSVAAMALSILYFTGDPTEYDLRNIRNRETTPTSAGALSVRMNQVVSRMNQSGRAVIVDRLDQVEPLVDELVRRREAAPADDKPFDAVVSIFSLMPRDQERKIELVEEIVDRVDRAKARGFVTDEQWKDLEQHLPRDLRPIGIEDLPAAVARPFEERDGTRGRIVYVAPTPGRSIYDAHYLLTWADSFREVALPNGDVIHASGDAVVFADMLRIIARDAPRVALLSFLGTVGVILIAFRGRRSGFIALACLLFGVSWMIAILYLLDVKLNFLNFVALPIAIGVGSDYAINVMKRRELEGDEGIEKAFTETGGAVVACSMTTLCGYTALLFSMNGAVRSLGLAAGLGEAATQLSAMIVLPAVLYWMASRGRAAPKPA